jgi:hypothetical protein
VEQQKTYLHALDCQSQKHQQKKWCTTSIALRLVSLALALQFAP